ncbi:MAG: arginine deiminase, partial [Actinomycetota bacterium]
MPQFGSASMTGTLKRVLVRPPLPEDVPRWREYGWRAAPDHPAAAAEHEALRELLVEAGAEVVVSRHDPGNPDAVYVYDPVLVGADGAVLLRPGKEGRRGEPAAMVAT